MSVPNMRTRVAALRGATDIKGVAHQTAEALATTQDALDLLNKRVNNAASSSTTVYREFSVLDYGATGDGSTDEWNALRRAMRAACEAGGGRLLFKWGANGRYRIGYNASDPDRTSSTGALDFSPWNNGGVWTPTENIEVYFENGVVLFMDNLMPNGYDAQTHAIYGRCRWTDVNGNHTPSTWNGYAVNYGALKFVNVTVEWTLGSQRGIGDSFRFTGTKSSSTAPYDILLENCQAYNAPQVGAIFCGCKQARTVDFYSENCWADTNHFNANFENCSATNTKAKDSKDDTVGVVTYYPDAITLARGLDTEVGPFTSPDQVTANNNGIVVDGVRKIGGKAHGVRLLGANGAIVSNVYVDAAGSADVGSALWAGSVEANGTTLAESGLAPRACQVTNVTARNGVNVGVYLVSQGTDGSEGDEFLKNDVLVDGIHVTDCAQVSIWGDNCKGFRIRNAKCDSVKCDFTNAWDFDLDMSSTGDVFITGTDDDYSELDMDNIPIRGIHIDRIKLDGGKLVITDVNKISAKQIEIHNSPGAAIEGIRVLDFMCPAIRVVNPNRSGTVALANIPVRCIPGKNWDVNVEVIHDNTPVKNLIEIGGGDAYNISRDIRINSVLTYEVAALSVDPYEIQGGTYAPVNISRRSRARKAGVWANVNIDDMPLQVGTKDLFANAVNLGTVVSDAASAIGVWLVQRAVSAGGGYLVCLGLNIKFDGTNWITGTDGSSNAASLVAMNYGDGVIQFYAIPSTGGTSQTIAPANLINYRRGYIDTTGKLTMANLKATSQAASKPARFSEAGDLSGGVIALTDSADVSMGSIPDGSLLKNDGGKVGAAGTFTANRLAQFNGSGLLDAHVAIANGKNVIGAGDGTLTTCEWSDVANNIAAALELLGFITTTAMATYAYSKGEVDSLLSNYSVTSHDHSYSGTTGETSGHTHSYSGTTS